MKNNTFREIGQQFENAESVLLFPHKNMDGDAMGSCAALCGVLRKLGKECYIVVEGGVPYFLAFLDRGEGSCGENDPCAGKPFCVDSGDVIAEPDICACIDCGELSRFRANEDAFLKGRTKICVDHHITSEGIADFNYIDPDAAATGELIYFLLTEGMGLEIDTETGEAIFAAITTDTGNFQYSNTTKQTHEITGKLYDAGIDANKVSVEIYETVRPERLEIQTAILSTMELFADGKGVIAYVTQKMLEDAGAELSETEGVVATLRSIKGVEVSVFLKEFTDGKIKVSMRAKTYANVAEIGQRHGGGGHVKAAGCSLDTNMADSIELMKKEVAAALSK